VHDKASRKNSRPDESIFKLSNQPCQQNDECQNLFGAFSGEEGLVYPGMTLLDSAVQDEFFWIKPGTDGILNFDQHFKDRPQDTKKQEKYMVREVEGVRLFFLVWLFLNL
jgi:hypothetical protein